MNKEEKKIIIIKEWETHDIPIGNNRGEISESEIEYIKIKFDKIINNSKDTFLFINNGNKIRISNTSYAGIIELKNIRLIFKPKIESLNLVYMMNYIRLEKLDNDFIYDIEKISFFSSSYYFSFFDFLGILFITQLKKIEETGFLKKYVKKIEETNFLKGKLLFKKQIINNILHRKKFYISYENLTIDTLENRILLFSLSLLVNLIKSNKKLINDINRYEVYLKDFITYARMSVNDCNKVKFNRLNNYYRDIIQLAKYIIRYEAIRDIEQEVPIGFNFLINMNKLYEVFISQIIDEIIKEDKKYSNLEVLFQEKINNLFEEKTIKIRPDILIKKEGISYCVLDTKYKGYESNTDYYQIISYSLSFKTIKLGGLIYPAISSKDDTIIYTLNRFPWKDKIKIYTFKIPINENNRSYEEYIKIIKKNIKDKIFNKILQIN